MGKDDYVGAPLWKIVEQLETCGYECVAGPLKLNIAFIELKRRAAEDLKMAICCEVTPKEGLPKYIVTKDGFLGFYPVSRAWYRCPHCASNDVQEQTNYCSHCGIKLKWIL